MLFVVTIYIEKLFTVYQVLLPPFIVFFRFSLKLSNKSRPSTDSVIVICVDKIKLHFQIVSTNIFYWSLSPALESRPLVISDTNI